MSLKIETYGYVDKNGRLQLHDRIGFLERVKLLQQKNVILILQEYKENRSQQQNRYYWGVVIPFVKTLLQQEGWDYELSEVHEFLKQQFAQEEIVNLETGQVRNKIISTAKMNKEQFQKYLERINLFVAEHFNTKIPQPNENKTLIVDL